MKYKFFQRRLPEEIAKIKLDDLRIVTTLGVGGFGRVELCTLAKDSSRAFALKKMKKCQVILLIPQKLLPKSLKCNFAFPIRAMYYNTYLI